jgi:predicted PurR-regulated permease PerM
MNLERTVSGLLLTIAIVVILIYGQNLLVPFIIAVLVWFLVSKVRSVLDLIPFFRHRVPMWIKSLITSVVIFSILGFLSSVLSHSINNLGKSYQAYEDNIKVMTEEINEVFGIDTKTVVTDFLNDFDFGAILESIFSSLSSILGNAVMILVYMLFIFLEATSFQSKIRAVCESEERYKKVRETLNRIESSITHYIGLKTLVSLITGVFSYLVLLMVGVESPVFWSFLIFLLNFIPTVGSLVGTLFPAFFSLLQFGSFQPFVIILLFVLASFSVSHPFGFHPSAGTR